MRLPSLKEIRFVMLTVESTRASSQEQICRTNSPVWLLKSRLVVASHNKNEVHISLACVIADFHRVSNVDTRFLAQERSR